MFIDCCQLLDDVIVESGRTQFLCKPQTMGCSPIQHDQHNTTGSRECEKTRFREAVRLELAIFEGSDVVLIFLVVAIEDGKIKIGGCL